MSVGASRRFPFAVVALMLVFNLLTSAKAQNFAGVLTQHNDNGRTGQNLSETLLTPSNVNPATFGKLFSYSVDGQMYSQPLYVPNVNIPGEGTHNVIYVETQNDSLYAFDADGLSATALWQVSFINPESGITPVSCMTDGLSDISCGVYPTYGITSTPVIDASTETMYLVTRTDNNGQYYQTLHAIDITTGAEKFGGPVNIAGSVQGTGNGSEKGVVAFQALRDIQRAGLLELNGIIYIGWAGAEHGWIMGYNATTLQQTAILNTTPNSTLGGVWASGNGIAADSSGNIYAAVGNALFDANAGGADYGDSLLKLNGDLGVLDYFTPVDQSCRQLNGLDLGSSGPILLPTQPGSVPNELLIAGKGGAPCDSAPAASRMYLLNQSDLGEYNAMQDQDVEEVIGSVQGYWSSPAYWQGANGTYVYSAGVNGAGQGDNLKQFTLTNGLLSTTPTAESTNSYIVGATPSISANGTQNGIVWAIERPETLGDQPGIGPAVLYAYDATDLTTLYNSGSALSNGVSRDRGGCANKFAVPTIANGKVYVGTQNELDVFGLLGSTSGPGVYLSKPCLTFAASTLGTPVQQTIGLTNSGTAALVISNITITGSNAADFSQTNNCTSLAPGAECTITAGFTASLLGPEAAYVTITDNAVGSPHNIYMVGVGEGVSVVTWPTPAPITYGTVLSATQLDATANVPGNFVYKPAAGSVLNAGTQTLSVTFTPTNTRTYPTTTKTVELQVNQALTTVSWAAPAAISYGSQLSAAQLDAVANVPGIFSYVPAAGTVLGAGSQSLSVTFTPTNAEDYSSASDSVALQVNPGSLAVTANDASEIYGQMPLLTYKITGFAGTDTASSATSGAPTETTTTTTTSSPGIYPVAISQGSLAAQNYNFTSFVNGSLTIEKAPTSVSVATQNSSIQAAQSTTLIATVSAAGTGVGPTGSVNFMLGGTSLAVVGLSSAGTSSAVATLTINGSQLSAGANSVTAVYSGDANYAASNSAAIAVTLLLSSQNSFGSMKVGTTASIMTLTYNFTTPATLSGVSILTGGQSGQDYTDGGGSTCVQGTVYTSGQSCVVTVAFTPSAAGVRSGTVELFAQGSDAPITVWYLSGIGQSGAVTIDPGTQLKLATLANNGQASGTALDGAGNVYVVDSANSQVLEFAAGTFASTAIVSSGLSNPTAVALDGGGNLYISDTGNSRVVMVPNEPGSLSSAAMTSVNINGLGTPAGLAVDSFGNLYVVDTTNADVLEIPAGEGNPVIAVSGLTNPSEVAVDTAGNLYVSTNTQVTEYPAGGGTPITIGSGFNNPNGLAVDASGAVYVADFGNSRIVRVAPGGASQSNLPVNGVSNPQGIAIDSSANLYFTAGGSAYEVNRTNQAAAVAFANTTVGSTSAPQTIAVSNAGNQTLTVSNVVATPNFTVVPSGGTNCTSNSQLASGSQCLVAVQFAPSTSNSLTGTLTLSDNALGNAASTQSIQLSGSALSAQTITFAAIPTQTYGAPAVSLSATASSGLAVSYVVTAGSAIVNGNMLTTTGAGSVTVQASQPGNNTYGPATPVSQTFTVNQAAQTITFTQNAPASAQYGSSFSIAATASSGLPVSFSASGACSQAGTTLTITSGSGTCTVVANQSGNGNYLPAQMISESTAAQRVVPVVTLSGVPASAPYQSSFPVTASSNSGVAPTMTVSAGICSIAGTTVTMITGTGKCIVTAKWAATKDYAAASASQSATAERLTVSLNWATPAPITYGTPLNANQLDATANVAGNFAYTPAAGKILGVGTHTLTVEFTPTLNQDYYSASAKVSLIVGKTTTATSITSNLPDPSQIGQAVTVQFAVVPASGYGNPTGRVKVSTGTAVGCSGLLTAAVGSCSLTFPASGSKSLTATYEGDSNDSESASTVVTQVVN